VYAPTSSLLYALAGNLNEKRSLHATKFEQTARTSRQHALRKDPMNCFRTGGGLRRLHLRPYYGDEDDTDGLYSNL